MCPKYHVYVKICGFLLSYVVSKVPYIRDTFMRPTCQQQHGELVIGTERATFRFRIKIS
jgi:hypothetical protein